MAAVTIEIDIDANGNATVRPNPAVVGNGDTVKWHVKSNAHGKGRLDVTLPPGTNSPFGNSDSIAQAGVNNPEGCEVLEPSPEPLNWPPGVTSYTYRVEFSGSPLISTVTAMLLKAGVAVPYSEVELERQAPTIINNYYLSGERQRYPHVVNNYYLGRLSILAGGPSGTIALTRTSVPLDQCKAVRVWLNDTGGNQTRTVGVYPSHGDFPANAGITVFVAPANHTGAPPAGSSPTSISENGDSVAKKVPNGSAIFVHLSGTPKTGVKADISEEP